MGCKKVQLLQKIVLLSRNYLKKVGIARPYGHMILNIHASTERKGAFGGKLTLDFSISEHKGVLQVSPAGAWCFSKMTDEMSMFLVIYCEVSCRKFLWEKRKRQVKLG